MRKFLFLIAFVLAVGFVYIGSGISEDASDKAAKLWNSMQEADYQNNWALWPGKGKLYKGTHLY